MPENATYPESPTYTEICEGLTQEFGSTFQKMTKRCKLTLVGAIGSVLATDELELYLSPEQYVEFPLQYVVEDELKAVGLDEALIDIFDLPERDLLDLLAALIAQVQQGVFA
ncbi:hypothetical protein IQ268_08695 [Oculatella sp. LEGE 06141]|uniref:hypothetical protein n=1 Tax=Oculatella sp. LEGE 06141 TaxID=1828648 RepID=UPI00188271B3|nr:hypothetical protein [Oculatella sp. LEGE 06141]MBE9178636.1 hypothetical protein [Oculatella sp. LEGE 06141]